MTRLTLPGLVDVHVHLRSPGGEHKESITTGTAAALAGGVTAVLAMPNTTPPMVDGPRLAAARIEHGRAALCDVGLYVGATEGNALAAKACEAHACGLKIYYNDTFGPLRIERLSALEDHFRHWPRGKPIVLHAEGVAVAAAAGLAATYGQRVHIAHVSTAEEIRFIASAKASGLPITCEVSPHHLFLTQEDLSRLGAYGHMRPGLGTVQDRDALWEHLDAVDCIATDHAPHTRAEKESDAPPPGVPGLETMLPLMLTAVHEGRLDIDRLVELTSTNPARIFGIETPGESSVEVELGPAWQLPTHGYQSRADWSPFAGMTVHGSVRRTVLRGAVVWQDGQLRAPPGTGRLLF